MKYKLIKEYPGSPKLGTIAEKESKIKSNTSYYYSEGDKRWCVYDCYVEDNPEYWEKVNENLWYVVSNRDYQEDNMLFQEWFIYSIETCFPKDNGVLLYFKTKEEADNFITRNKPCLSLNDVSLILGVSDRKRDIFLELKRIVKLKL